MDVKNTKEYNELHGDLYLSKEKTFYIKKYYASKVKHLSNLLEKINRDFASSGERTRM